MPPALATFRAAGLDLVPWPADFQVQRRIGDADRAYLFCPPNPYAGAFLRATDEFDAGPLKCALKVGHRLCATRRNTFVPLHSLHSRQAETGPRCGFLSSPPQCCPGYAYLEARDHPNINLDLQSIIVYAFRITRESGTLPETFDWMLRLADLAGAYSENTIRAYRADFHQFEEWCA